MCVHEMLIIIIIFPVCRSFELVGGCRSMSEVDAVGYHR